MSKWQNYWRNWGLFLRGFRWCWERDETHGRLYQYDAQDRRLGISYQSNWAPLKFVALVYWWDYGLATLLGRGVQSLSRAFELFGEKHHWGQSGPILWGSVDLWKK